MNSIMVVRQDIRVSRNTGADNIVLAVFMFTNYCWKSEMQTGSMSWPPEYLLGSSHPLIISSAHYALIIEPVKLGCQGGGRLRNEITNIIHRKFSN